MSADAIPMIAALARLALAGERRERARELARQLGAEELLILIRDEELGVWLPAPGFPQTLPDGLRWARFFAELTDDPFLPPRTAELPYPGLGIRKVEAHLAADGAVLALLGGTPRQLRVQEILAGLPLLTKVLAAEHAVQSGAASAELSRVAAERAESLAAALAKAQRELQGALREVRAAERRKDEFLAMLAHELRNPLAPLLTTLELMKVRRDPEPRMLEVAIRQALRLSRLVDDLLDVSRVTQGKISLQQAPVELGELVREAVEQVEVKTRTRDQTISLALPDEPVWMRGDRERLHQVLANVLGNATKFTPKGGAIGVSLSAASDRLHLKIRDTGKGIPAELLPSIFEVFAQGPVTLDRTETGLGIGLALVKSLTELHGGCVTARSEGPGLGSEFTLSFPRIEAPAASESPTWTPPAGAPPSRILIVDDNVDGAAMLEDYLTMAGNEVAVVHDGPSALARSESFRPQVVFLDIGLPGKDGYAVARELRQAAGPQPYLVALTGYGAEEDRRRMIDAGFDAHLLKPPSLDRIDELLREASMAGTSTEDGASPRGAGRSRS
jgi:signal transduction histidine kinase/ActR/RegA family two-component response regulator